MTKQLRTLLANEASADHRLPVRIAAPSTNRFDANTSRLCHNVHRHYPAVAGPGTLTAPKNNGVLIVSDKCYNCITIYTLDHQCDLTHHTRMTCMIHSLPFYGIFAYYPGNDMIMLFQAMCFFDQRLP